MFGEWLSRMLVSVPTINRWQGEVMIRDANPDSTHMWAVAVIAEGLSRIEEEKFGNKVDIALLLRKCIFHDCLESFTGDIRSDVKKKSDDMKRVLEEVEEIIYKEKVESLIPESWRSDYKNYLLNPKDNKQTLEGKILAVADNIAALNECILEVKLGNNTFLPYLEVIANDILDVELESGKYFIKNCLVDLGLPKEQYGARVIEFLSKDKDLV